MVNKLSAVCVFMMLFTGCEIQSQENSSIISNSSGGNPTPEEILTAYPDADIFFARSIVYSNAEGSEHLSELNLSLGEEITEIKKQTNEMDEFESGTATHLPVGTKIYEPEEQGHGDILIAVVDGEEKIYSGQIEG